jgi:hypothetical protein
VVFSGTLSTFISFLQSQHVDPREELAFRECACGRVNVTGDI